MPPLPRLLFLVLSLLTAFFLFFYISIATIPYTARPSLFPQSAIISLTDDNSTFFLARPAAFGPMLPNEAKGGLTGQLFVVEDGELGCEDVKEEGVWGMRKSLESWSMGGLGDGEDDVVLGTQKRSMPGLDNGKEPLDSGTKLVIPFVTNSGLITSETSTKQQQSRKASFEEYKLSLSSEELELASHADIETLQDSALMEGRIVLIQRGGCGFLEKVLWAQRRGALALIVGDYQRGRPLLTMYARGDTSNVTIPSLFTTYTTAQLLTSLIPSDKDSKENNGGRRFGDDGESDNGGKVERTKDGSGNKPRRGGLWITLTATRGPASPFFDTLLVLVISPLVTLGVVYAWLVMLTLRASIQRRRWRAPKSVVESFPVRIYTSNGRERDQTLQKRRHSNGAYNDEAGPVEAGELQSGLLASPAYIGQEDQPALMAAMSPTPPLTPPQSPTPTSTRRRLQKSKESPLDKPCFYSTTTECVICLEDYIEGISRVMRLPCGHEFHVGCITPWLVTRRRTCPICKIDVVKGRRDSPDEEGTSDMESGSGVSSDSSSSGDDSSGYEVDELGTDRSEGLFTSYRGLFDWRRIFGGIGLGLGHERSLSAAREDLRSHMGPGDEGDTISSWGREARSDRGLFITREANERTPLIRDRT